MLDIMDYYFSERGFDVCRIDGSVKLDERKRQVIAAYILMQIQYVFVLILIWIEPVMM